MQLPVGLLVDHFNIRKLLVLAISACSIGSILFVFHPLGLAMSGRFLVGFGSAFAFVGALKLITLLLPPNRFATASGGVFMLGMLGAATSDILLSNLVHVINWRLLGCILAIVGLLLAIFTWRNVPEKKITANESDTKKIHVGMKQLLRELFHLLKNTTLLKIGLIGCLLYLPLSLFAEFWSIPFLHQVYSVPNRVSAHITSLIFIGVAIGSLVVGIISDLLKRRCLPIIICSALTTGLFCFILLMPHISEKNLYWSYFFIGFFTSAQVLVFALAREATSQNASGTAMAITNMIAMFGGALFQPLVGFLLELVSGIHTGGSLSMYPGKFFRIVLFILPICIATGCYLTLRIKDTCTLLNQTD
jgi:MFS family permease